MSKSAVPLHLPALPGRQWALPMRAPVSLWRSPRFFTSRMAKGRGMGLIGDEAGKTLASAWLSPQGKPRSGIMLGWAGLGWVVWCPHYGWSMKWKGQAPAGLNAVLAVLP